MRQVFADLSTQSNNTKKLSFYSGSQGYVASSGSTGDWIGFTTDSGRTFLKKPIGNNVDYNGFSVNLTFGFTIEGVKAFNQDTVIVYGDYGWVPSILYSTNGGNTFKLVFHSKYDPNQLRTGVKDMIFPGNSTVGYAVDADRILKSTNRGLSWFVAKIESASFLSGLSAGSPNAVFAFNQSYGNPKLLKTVDGTNWTIVALPGTPATTNITDVFFLTGSKGWLNIKSEGYIGQVFYTSDGGHNWRQMNHNQVSPFFSVKMQFVNDSTGYALSDVYQVFKTTDSGKVWERLPRDNNFTYLGWSHFDLQCFNEHQLWAGGGRNFLELSTNGGGTPFPKALFRIDTTGVKATNQVKLINFSKPVYQVKWFVNNVLTSTAFHTTYLHSPQSGVDSIKLVVSNGSYSDTIVHYQYFTPVPPVPVPSIASFLPVSASTDGMVTITGTNFVGITEVRFGGTLAASFSVISPTQINAIVGEGTSGNVSVSNAYGTTVKGGFTYTTRLKITDFAPASGPVGTTVYINGTNFSTTPAENEVRIGTIKAEVVVASSTQLAVKVPAGTILSPISVRVGNATVFSTKPFITTFDAPCNFTSASFAARIDSSGDVQSKHLFVRDLDGDGKPDIVTTSDYISRLAYFRNTSENQKISFEAKKLLTISSGAYATWDADLLNIEDMNGDGKPDLCATTDNAGFLIFRNSSVPGNISFGAPVKFPYPDMHFNIADFDGDGRPDVVTFARGGISVLKNTSTVNTFSFGPVQEFTVSRLRDNSHYEFRTGDINNDGKTDVVLAMNYGQNVELAVFINTTVNGTISFAAPVVSVPTTSSTAKKLFLGDLDNDGKIDIALLKRFSLAITLMRNTSAGATISFTPPVDISVASENIDFAFGDVNGDGKPDMLVSHIYNRAASLYLNQSSPGTIAFASPKYIGVESYPFSFDAALADIDLDGKPDIATMNYRYGSPQTDHVISIFRNRACEPLAAVACPGGSISLVAEISGATYQWQVNTGSSFVNVTNGVNFSGANSQKLTLMNLPSSWYDYQFRCVTNVETGPVYTLKFQNNWTGNFGTAWEHPANWSCGRMPDGNTDVIISKGPVVLGVNGICRSITISPGVSFTVRAGVGLTITR